MLPLPADRTHHDIQKATPTTAEIVGQSGRRYLIERVLQDKEILSGRVFLATDGNEKLVLKEIRQENFQLRLDIYRRVGSCPYLRTLQDTVPDQSMFVYKYLNENLLRLAQKNLPITLTKQILKDALRGLAALHDQDIVHNDVKANNILIEAKENHNGILVERVQLADLEDAAHVPPGRAIIGAQVGNWMWRSPEAHAQGPVDKPSDIFSFGIVCIYTVIKRVIFAVNEEELAEGEEVLAMVLERQISYFADEDGLNGLLKYLGDSPWCQIFEVLRGGFNKSNPRQPFSLWQIENVDEDFKDLISGLTNFDPAKRLTAYEALAHRWFAGV